MALVSSLRTSVFAIDISSGEQLKLCLLPQPLVSKLLVIGNDTLNIKKQEGGKKDKTKPATDLCRLGDGRWPVSSVI